MKAQALFLVLSRASGAAFQAILLVLVARQMRPAEFGTLGSMLSVITLLVMVASLGTAQVVLRERAAGRNDLVSSAVSLGAVTSWALVIAGSAVLSLMLGLEIGPPRWVLAGYVLLLALVGEKGAEVRTSFMIADRERVPPAFNLVLRRVSAVLLFVVLTVGFDSLDPAVAFGVAYAFGSWIGYAVGWSQTRYRCPVARNSVRESVSAARAAWPYLSNNISSLARTLDVFVVSVVSGAAQGGLYAAAYRVTSPFLLVTTGVATAVVPHSVGTSRQGATTFAKKLTLLHGVLLAGLTPLAWLASPMVGKLLGDEYADAGPLLSVLIAGLVLVGLSTLLGSVLQGQGRADKVARAGVAFLPLLAVGVAAGAAIADAAGTAVAVAIVFALKSGYLLHLCRRV